MIPVVTASQGIELLYANNRVTVSTFRTRPIKLLPLAWQVALDLP
jgi:hypothetical protein